MESEFALSTLYPRVYLFTLDDDTLSPLQIHFKALTQRQLDFFRSLKTTNTLSYQSFFLNEAIIKIENVLSTDGKSMNISPDMLPKNIKDTLFNIIKDVSVVTKDIFDKIKLNISLFTEDKFNTDTWDCDICREKGLDKARNCKFNNNLQEDYDNTFFVIVDGEKYEHCPMFYKNNDLMAAIVDSYNLFSVGILPEVGGIADQTEFFGLAVTLMNQNKNNKMKDTT